MSETQTGVPMTRNIRIMILKRAREILSDRSRWTVGGPRGNAGRVMTLSRKIGAHTTGGAPA